ncbi:hypothetical protein D3C71_1304240 [compost metagenome]
MGNFFEPLFEFGQVPPNRGRLALKGLLCVDRLKHRLLLLVDLNQADIVLILDAPISGEGLATNSHLLAAGVDLCLDLRKLAQHRSALGLCTLLLCCELPVLKLAHRLHTGHTRALCFKQRGHGVLS